MRSIERGLEKAIRERQARKGRRHSNALQHWRDTPPDFTKLSPYLVTILDPKSLAAEQFKRMRTQVLGKMKGRMGNTVMVTSSVPGEGKTTTAINLAISISQGIAESVLMIDTDFRKPGLHSHLGIEVEKGLVDYLQGDVEVEDILIKTEIPKLSILPSGVPPENPSELLSSERMTHLIHDVKTRYDNRFIIFDSSPVNVFTDTDVLVPQMEGILFVVKDGSTPREYVLRAMSRLEEGNILGICLNMVSAPEPVMESYYYYYDYSKSDDYHQSEE